MGHYHRRRVCGALDSVEWHKKMVREGHLYQAMIGKDLVGAAIVFPDETEKSVYVNLHSGKRLEGVLQELSGIIADLQDM